MATFLHDGAEIDYTPGSAVAAGDVIELGAALVGVAKKAIAANAKGSLSLEGVFEFPKTAGGSTAIAMGDPVYWSGTVVTETSTSNPFLGHCVEAAADGATTCKVRLMQGAPG